MLHNRTELAILAVFIFIGGIFAGSQLYTSNAEYGQLGSVGSAVIRPTATHNSNGSQSSQSSTYTTVAPAPTSAATSPTQPVSSAVPARTASRTHIPPLSTLVGTSFGNTSTLVRDLQNVLGSLGFFEGEATGYFGNMTARALARFQGAQKLAQSSAVTGETVSALSSQISSNSTSGGGCSGPVYAGASAWPPHGPENPEPPLPPPHSNPPYVPGIFDCKDFARNFCDLYAHVPGSSCEILGFDQHTINRVHFTDSNGQSWTCYVEPQTEESVCRRGNHWDDVEKSWVKNILCRQIYGKSEEQCNAPIDLYNPPLPLCGGLVGTSCTPGTGQGMCIDSVNKVQDASCVCPNGSNCTWRLNHGPNELCPDSPPAHEDDELVPFWKQKKILCYYAEPIFVPQDNQ